MTLTIQMDCFEIAFRKSQLQTVFKFFGNVEKFKKAISKYQVTQRRHLQSLWGEERKEETIQARKLNNSRNDALLKKEIVLLANESQKLSQK